MPFLQIITTIGTHLEQLKEFLLGWPIIIYVFTISLICTIALSFVQLRYFFRSWKLTLFPDTPSSTQEKTSTEKVDMTPFQAFVNTLSTSLGNGSIAGMATAIHVGGPGAAFWVLVIGLLTMAIRFAEVFLSTYFRAETKETDTIGGPMLYLKSVVGGNILSYLFAATCLCYGLIVGCAMQTNSIRVSAIKTMGAWGITVHPLTVAIIVFLFVGYVVLGGAPRVIALSNKIVPLKVGLFFTSALIVLLYNYNTILSALKLIVTSAFAPSAALGGAVGFSVQQAIRFGMIRAINATESGLGTAAIFFSSTGSKKPIETGIMSMLITCTSTIVCFLICLLIVATGVWNSGLTSTALTIAAYESTFGPTLAGIIVSFLSITFGIGVVVGFVYVSRECWLFLTKGRFKKLFDITFSLLAFLGALVKVKVIWDAGDIINATMLVINFFGILYLIPLIKKQLTRYKRKS